MTISTGLTQAADAVQAKSNKPTRQYYLDRAKEFGETFGTAKDSQIKFDLDCIAGAFHGAYSTDPNKNGAGRGDWVEAAEIYTRAAGSKTIFDTKKNGNKRLVSNAKKCMESGANPKWGKHFLQYVQDFVEFRQKVRAKDASVMKKLPAGKTAEDLDDAHNGLMRLLTALKKQATLLPENERNLYAFKTDKKEKDEVDLLEDARKLLLKSDDKSPQITAAVHSITQRLANIAKGQ